MHLRIDGFVRCWWSHGTLPNFRPHPGFQAGWGQTGDCPFLDFSRRAPSLLAVASDQPAGGGGVPQGSPVSEKSFGGRAKQISDRTRSAYGWVSRCPPAHSTTVKQVHAGQWNIRTPGSLPSGDTCAVKFVAPPQRSQRCSMRDSWRDSSGMYAPPFARATCHPTHRSARPPALIHDRLEARWQQVPNRRRREASQACAPSTEARGSAAIPPPLSYSLPASHGPSRQAR